MPSGYAYGKSFRTVKTCVGSDFCRFGVGDSTALGIAIEERYQGLASPAKMKLAVTGCPRNCAEALCKDLGVVAVDGGRWEIYVGGAAGAHIRKGDLLATVDDADEVMTLTGRFLQYYRENANWLERTYAWVPRVGIEHDPRRGGRRRRGHRRADWTRACRSRLTPTATRGRTAGSRRPRGSSGRRCRCCRCPRCRCDERREVDVGPSRRDPGRRGPHVRRRRRADRGVPAARRLLRAVDAVCPHRGGPLADGLADDRVVVCPLHGHTFDMCTGS